MKKISTLIVALVATLSAMAQMHGGTLKFIGNGEFYLPAMQETTLTQTVKDAVTVNMGSETQSFDVPSLYYAAMNMTIYSFNIPGLAFTMTGSYATGDMKFEWHGNDITTTSTAPDGSTKSVTITAFSAAYDHAKGKLNMSLDFSYGSMPFPLHYAIEAYYTTDNALGLVGQGTEGNPYKIYDATDFMAIANNISADNTFEEVYFAQMDDIDFGGTAEAPVQLPAIGKAAITSITTVAWGFDGTYDGRFKSIKGIYHTSDANDAAGKFNGLFSSIGTKGTVKSIVFDADNYVSSYNYVGAIASISKGTIDHCTNNANITATNAFAGGICGYLASGLGTIQYCENTGDIKAMTYATGIVSGSQSGTTITEYASIVKNCTNHGNISTTNGVGSAGIAGSFSGTITECSNDGTIDDSQGIAKTTMNTAGILSNGSYIVEVSKCNNVGAVKGSKSVGGIIGNIMKGDDANLTVSDCKNTGSVQGTGTNVGGIIGTTARTTGIITLAGCENYGLVESTGTETLIGNLRGNAAIVLSDCTIGSGLALLPLDPGYDGVQGVSADDAATVKNGAYVKDGRIVIVKDGNAYSVTGIKY